MVTNPILQAKREAEKALEQQGADSVPTQALRQQGTDTIPTQAVGQQGTDSVPAQANPILQAKREAEQALETGKGLPEVGFVFDAPEGSFEADIQSIYRRGKAANASPEEIANMIKAEYGDKYVIQKRKVPQQEKDDMWTPGLFVADEEYIVYDPQTEQALSLDNPGFSGAQVVGAATAIGKEIPGALLTRGRSIPGKMAGMGVSGATVNLGDQYFIKKWGGKESINPWEVGAAGVLTAGSEAFSPVLYAGGRLFGAARKRASNFFDTLGINLAISRTRQTNSNITGTAPSSNIMTEAEAEEALAKYQKGITASQLAKMTEQAQDRTSLYGGLPSNIDDVKTPISEKLKGVVDYTPAEKPDATIADVETEKLLRKNFPAYDSQLDRRVDDAYNVVDRPLATTSTIEGRTLKKLESEKIGIETDIAELQADLHVIDSKLKDDTLDDNARQLYEDDAADLTHKIEEKGENLDELDKHIASLATVVGEEVKTSSLSKESLGQSVVENTKLYHQELQDAVRKPYEVAEYFGMQELPQAEIDRLLPEESINRLPVQAKPVIDRFKEILQGGTSIGGSPIKPTRKNIDEAYKYLNAQIDKLYKENEPVLAKQLDNIRKQFNKNFDILLFRKSEEDVWASNIKKGRDAHAHLQKVMPEGGLLKKVVDEVNKGQKSVQKITNMLFNVSGVPTFSEDVAEVIIANAPLRESIKDYIYATTFFKDGVPLTGNKLTARFNDIKNNQALRTIFGDEDWEDFKNIAEALQPLNKLSKKSKDKAPQGIDDILQSVFDIASVIGGKGLLKKALDALGISPGAKLNSASKRALKEYILRTVIGAKEPPKLIDGKPVWLVQRPTTAALFQDEAEIAGDIIDTATGSNEEETK